MNTQLASSACNPDIMDEVEFLINLTEEEQLVYVLSKSTTEEMQKSISLIKSLMPDESAKLAFEMKVNAALRSENRLEKRMSRLAALSQNKASNAAENPNPAKDGIDRRKQSDEQLARAQQHEEGAAKRNHQQAPPQRVINTIGLPKIGLPKFSLRRYRKASDQLQFPVEQLEQRLVESFNLYKKCTDSSSMSPVMENLTQYAGAVKKHAEQLIDADHENEAIEVIDRFRQVARNLINEGVLSEDAKRIFADQIEKFNEMISELVAKLENIFSGPRL